MFVGEYLHTVDNKGRLAVPARFRARIEGGAVLTRGVESCLYVFPLDTWERKGRELAEAALDPRQRRLIERRFFGMGFEVELDAQGRIVVPARFRQYAGLEGETVVLGVRDRIEIWSPARWDEYIAAIRDEDLADLPLPF
ncbi:MAG TPA: division/cell wall cluster transcriptional repressor MraZ [Ktedonobacterales bacterium]|jgi:MraZ protein